MTMWNPFKKKDPLEGQRANYALAFVFRAL